MGRPFFETKLGKQIGFAGRKTISAPALSEFRGCKIVLLIREGAAFFLFETTTFSHA